MDNSAPTNATTATAPTAARARWEILTMGRVPLGNMELEVRHLDDAHLPRQSDPDGDVDVAAAWIDEAGATRPWRWEGLDMHLDGDNGVCDHGRVNGSSTSDPLSAPHATCFAPPTSRIAFMQPLASSVTAPASPTHHSAHLFDHIVGAICFYLILVIATVIALVMAFHTEYFLLSHRTAALKRQIKHLKHEIRAVGDDKAAAIIERCVRGMPLEESEVAARELEEREDALHRRLDGKRKALKSAKRHLRGFEAVKRGWRRFGWRGVKVLLRSLLLNAVM